MFTFFVFDWKYPSWTNLVQKIKIVSLSRNLVPKLFRTCRIQWWFSLSLFLDREHLFRAIWSWSLLFFCLIQEISFFSVSATRLKEKNFEIDSFRQYGLFNLLQWVRLWIVSVHCLKNFLNNFKRKQNFYFKWIIFLLKSTLM